MKGSASFPSAIGQCVWEGVAKDQDRWRYPSNWLERMYPQEHRFCMEYEINEGEIQDRHQSEMDKDGFFNSDTNCAYCEKNISTGDPYYRHEETSQGPICQQCAEEIEREEAINAARNS